MLNIDGTPAGHVNGSATAPTALVVKGSANTNGNGISVPPLNGVETVLDNERVGAYRIKLAPGASIGPLTIPGPSIRVAMGDGKLLYEAEETLTAMRLTPAQFVFQPQATTATFTNRGDTELELVEFVLK